MKEPEYKVISFIKDPHVVFEDTNYDRATLYSGYRVLIEDMDGGIYVRSLSECDVDGDQTAGDIVSRNYEDCVDATHDVIVKSIEAWRSPKRNSSRWSEKETAEYVLKQFLRANMIDQANYDEILSEYK